jgi:hypothetical protein
LAKSVSTRALEMEQVCQVTFFRITNLRKHKITYNTKVIQIYTCTRTLTQT